MKKLLYVLFFAFVAIGCGDRIHNEHQDVTEPLTMKKDEVHTYKPTIADNAINYNVIIALRHHSEITKSEIKVALEMTSPSGKVTKTSHTLPLRDASGKLLGEVAVHICDTETIIMKDYTFPENGEYTVKISPITDEDINGMMEIGLVIEKPKAE